MCGPFIPPPFLSPTNATPPQLEIPLSHTTPTPLLHSPTPSPTPSPPSPFFSTPPPTRYLKCNAWKCETFLNRIEEHRQATKGKNTHITIINDLHGLGRQHFTMRIIQLLKKVSRAIQDNYPEMMAKTIVIRAPWIFTAIWRVVRKFLDAKVLDKIDICGSNNFLPVLEKHIDREWIPQYLGGDCATGGEAGGEEGRDTDPFCTARVNPGGLIPKSVIQRHHTLRNAGKLEKATYEAGEGFKHA